MNQTLREIYHQKSKYIQISVVDDLYNQLEVDKDDYESKILLIITLSMECFY